MSTGIELRATRYEVDDRVAVVTLDRPDRLNAWTGRMAQEFRWSLGEADRDPSVRAVVVTGAGRGFCAGADFRALDNISSSGTYDPGLPPDGVPIPARPGAAPDYTHDFSFLLGLPKPVIACVNGAAAGVGFVLMAFCDVRFAASGAKLTTSFARLGLPAEHGVSWVLSRLLGPARAADLLLSSRIVSAEEAHEMGLVNFVHPAERVLDEAIGYARRLAYEASPRSLATMKAQLWRDLGRDLHASATEAERLVEEMVGSDDFREGVAAFREKRVPRFPPLP